MEHKTTSTDRRAAKLLRHAMFYLIQSRGIHSRWDKNIKSFTSVALTGTPADVAAVDLIVSLADQLPCRHKTRSCCWAHCEQSQHGLHGDSECIVDDATGCCAICHAAQGDPCPECGQSIYHKPDCSLSD